MSKIFVDVIDNISKAVPISRADLIPVRGIVGESASIGNSAEYLDKMLNNVVKKGTKEDVNVNSVLTSTPEDNSSVSTVKISRIIGELQSDEQYDNKTKNPFYSKMNRNNTDEKKYKECCMHFEEKADSPVSILIEDAAGKNRFAVEKFFLTYVSYERKEKMQLMSMLDSSDMIYFFGDSAVMVSFAGVCLDTYNFQWLRDMTDLYKERLRGSMSTAKGEKIKIMYDDEVLEGVIINMSTGKTSASLNQAEIKFTMLLTDRTSISLTNLEKNTVSAYVRDMTKMSKEVESAMAARAEKIVEEKNKDTSGNSTGTTTTTPSPVIIRYTTSNASDTANIASDTINIASGTVNIATNTTDISSGTPRL